jgi:Tfp pilus assembly protein PilN
LELQTSKLEQQVQALHAYEVLATQREGVQAVVQSIYASRTLLSDVLDAVSLVVPDNAWFQSLELSAVDPGVAEEDDKSKDGTITISGKTYSFEDISRLVVRLQLIPALSDVQLTQANEEEGSADAGTVDVKSFSIGAAVGNVELGGSLPLTDVEVPAK